MSSPDEGHTPPSSANSSGFKIPESKDGFFGYNEKMNLEQIHVNVLTNRRGSDAGSDVGNLNPVSITNSIYEEGEEDERQRKQLLGEAHITGMLFFYDHYPCFLPPSRTNCQR